MTETPLIIFDCDGVLVDSEAIASRVFAEQLYKAGFDYSTDECRLQFTGLSLDSCRQQIEALHSRALPENFFAQLQSATFARFAQQLRAVDGINNVLDFLDTAGWNYCVASSGSYDKMRFTLGLTHLLPRVEDRLFSASDVLQGKPAPDLFLHAARQCGYRAQHCIVIEDAAPGILAAQRAGMLVCAYGEQHTGIAQTPSTVAFTDMSELPAILTRLYRQQVS